MKKTVISALAVAVVAGLILLLVEYSFLKNEPEDNSNSLQVNDSPNSVNIAGDNNTVSKLDLPKPEVELIPFEINIPNPNSEIGFHSEYVLNIIANYTVADFSMSIKLPNSAWEVKEYVRMHRDNDATGQREFFEPEYQDGYAIFKIKNAAGSYHLVFASKKPEQLKLSDIQW